MELGSRHVRSGPLMLALLAGWALSLPALARAQSHPVEPQPAAARPAASSAASPGASPAAVGPVSSASEPEPAAENGRPPAPIWIAQPGWNAYPAVPSDLPPLPTPPTRRDRQHLFLNPGYLFSMTPAVASREHTSGGRTSYTDVATGHGLEVSLAIWQPRTMANFGMFAQVQRYLSFNGNHNRYAFGLQAAWAIFGFETGLAHRESDDSRRATTMVHFGPVLSMAFLNVGARFGIPITVASDSRPVHKAEASMIIAVKVPIPLQ